MPQGLRLALSTAAGVLAAASVQAQTASQIAPPPVRHEVQPLRDGGVSAVPAPEPVSPGSGGNLRVQVRQVVVTGGMASMRDRTAVIASGVSHRLVSVAELYAAAHDLEAAYARAGYILVRVVVPAQDLRDGGDVTLVVVNGFIERIDTSALPPQIRDYVARTLAPLARRPGVRLSDIERKVLLAGDAPGAFLRTTLARGSEPGGTVLIVQAQFVAHSASVDVDDSVGHSLGTYSSGLNFALNSPYGQGEQLYARVDGDPANGWNGIGAHNPINRSLALGGVVPLRHDGLSISFDALGARTAPQHSAGALGLASDFGRVALGLHYAVVRTRQLNLNAGLSIDADKDRLSAITPVKAPVSLDRTRVVRLGLDAFAVQGDSSLTGSVTASFGLAGLGARTQAQATPDLPLSRQGADARFSKLEAEIGYLSNLGRCVQFSLHVRGQSSFGKPLLTSEQAGLAGPGGLSAFDSGLVQGDQALLARAELAAPGAVSVTVAGMGASPYVFVAAGKAIIEDPTALEPNHIDASSYGLGVRTSLNRPPQGGIFLTLEWARGWRGDVHGMKNHVGVSVSSRF